MTHEIFKRNNNNLIINMTITLKEALLGLNRTIKHIDDEEILIEKKGVI